ncbi:hypothetical protein APHNP_0907 [Anaplasma phagocytophilum str. ApNP]|uniref:Uncharacterized protein n=2 Tax=Anaplasma phagocytophilum TaxID=948 RepID=A0A0F3NI74_ANAPH|nr:hypothetical protein APHMUC_1113 [Anaplasma phagocytophilum str. ApMUC09]KJV67491.1 hypothetical protein APHNP_0907 [Anaplasma phagocytophilum str. ApNP]
MHRVGYREILVCCKQNAQYQYDKPTSLDCVAMQICTVYPKFFSN